MERRIVRKVKNEGITFNRTILELKHLKYLWVFLLHLLLIEPFWNWNYLNVISNKPPSQLLIEPFWNWNCFILYHFKEHRQAFNRTILELKHGIGTWMHEDVAPFNRTILELKLSSEKNNTLWFFLLIEPFWNWNSLVSAISPLPVSLLIEPFWNWNSTLTSIMAMPVVLLIEPFWNWNQRRKAERN